MARPLNGTSVKMNEAGGVVLHPGLENVYLSETRLSHVDGQNGRLVIAGYPVEEIAPRATFEEMVFLVLKGRLPNESELSRFHAELVARRALPEPTLALLDQVAQRPDLTPMDVLSMATATLEFDRSRNVPGGLGIEDEALRVLARLPVIVAYHARSVRDALFREVSLAPSAASLGLRETSPRETSLAPRDDLSHAANFLYLLHGQEPTSTEVRALDTYLNTVIDHGANASTFTARVIQSTGSDLLSSVLGALGALKGPLHGGAPGPALDMIFEIGQHERAEEVLRSKLERGERLMGFGHRVYKVRDPRAAVLDAAAARLYESRAEGREIYDLTRHVEAVATRLLDQYKPGRQLRANVELFTALLLHGLGIGSSLFTAIFAMGRTAGWIAHASEQGDQGRLIRPRLAYKGELDRRFVPTQERPS